MKDRSRRWKILVSVLLCIGVLEAILGAIYVTSLYGIPETSPTQSRIEFAGSSYSSFPRCAVVSVDWHDEDGGAIGFAVQQTAAVKRAVTCNDPSISPPNPPNQCPPAVCWKASYAGAPPVMYQNGSHGTFQFRATEGDYVFSGYRVPNSTHLSPDHISVNLSYAVSIIPPDWYVGARAGLAIVGFVTAAAVVALVVEPRVRGRTPHG